jgi:peptidoglycan/xylan/chitin deacetylase (PgdA/CDA1 family)
MLPILCYHNVGPEREVGRRLNVAPETLEAHVRHFCRKRRRFARAGDLAEGIPAGCVCLTFDDAYLSAVGHGVEVLAKYGVWGTFFCVPGHVGGTSAWDQGHAQPLAGWDALRAAQAQGMEIGNHTMSHPDLSQLNSEAQVAEIELAEDMLIEHGLDGRSLCYPYGRFNGETRRAVEQEKIQVGLALGRRPARPGDDLLFLPRIVVAFSDRLPKLLYKIHIRPKLPSFRRRGHYVS